PSTVIDLPTRAAFAAGAEIFLTAQILHLEGEALMPIWQARRAGKSEELLLCAAGMVLELWEFVDQLRQSPETRPGALSTQPSPAEKRLAPKRRRQIVPQDLPCRATGATGRRRTDKQEQGR
ncbi:MAG: hypothetical protein GY835_22340, partial [bacterium]|nr:hypothetical protein [bacterium]